MCCFVSGQCDCRLLSCKKNRIEGLAHIHALSHTHKQARTDAQHHMRKTHTPAHLPQNNCAFGRRHRHSSCSCYQHVVVIRHHRRPIAAAGADSGTFLCAPKLRTLGVYSDIYDCFGHFVSVYAYCKSRQYTGTANSEEPNANRERFQTRISVESGARFGHVSGAREILHERHASSFSTTHTGGLVIGRGGV